MHEERKTEIETERETEIERETETGTEKESAPGRGSESGITVPPLAFSTGVLHVRVLDTLHLYFAH